ncbi:MAG: hypothetical protein EBT19_01780 [Methylocystaceae bacterium]|nr:hypothetical protein [Methylocystaceae bacterium]NBV94130.1 hypothetical protein [Methylocystaceae bacterium]
MIYFEAIISGAALGNASFQRLMTPVFLNRDTNPKLWTPSQTGGRGWRERPPLSLFKRGKILSSEFFVF